MDEVRGSIPLDSTEKQPMKKAVTSSVFGLFLFRSGGRSAPRHPRPAARAREALRVALPACFLFGLLACKDPNAVSTPAGDAAAAVTTIASAAPTPQCATDTDCRTFSSYCQESPCACQPLGKADRDPKCAATVSCFVNPCARKSAACQNGKCELVVK